MESSGFIFYNSDDEKQKNILSNYKNKFGFGKETGDLNYLVKAENPNIIIEVKNNTFKSTLFGNYNIPNIISAISIGIFLGVPIEKVNILFLFGKKEKPALPPIDKLLLNLSLSA